MRTLAGIAAALAGLTLFGCSTAASGTPDTMLMLDATVSTNPNYCRDQCENEQNLGTLMGTLQACVTACCTNTPSGCPATSDAGSSSGNEAGTTTNGGDSGGDDDDGGEDAGPAPTKCTSPEQCPGGYTVSCCELQPDGTGICAPVNDAGAQVCLCKVGMNDCPSVGLGTAGDTTYDLGGCCAPQTNAAGEPSGPYVCKPNDAKAYDCCYQGSGNCQSGFCCVIDPNQNQFCALPCTGDAGCGAAQCLSTYDFDFTLTTCKEEGKSAACGP